MAQTSDRVSRIASKYVNVTSGELLARISNGPADFKLLTSDIRTLAATALRQDETRGQRKPGLVAKLLGR